MRRPSQLQVGWQWLVEVCHEVLWWQHLEPGLVTRDVNEHQVVHVVADQDGVVGVGVVVIAVVGHVNPPDHVPAPVGQTDEGDHGFLFDGDIFGYRLGAA